MAQVENSIEISADRDAVWAAIADLDSVAVWNPNIESATCDSDSAGLGATRTCHLSRGGLIEEVVSAWDDGRRLQFAIGSHGGIRSADMGLDLASTGDGTRVTATADYHLAFGPIGPVIDRIAVKRQMARMLEQLLAGLKKHIEGTSSAASLH
ncbi:MAG: SRPBCC family protein [Actinomycetota bacterium]|nr:SRPBCC family protein [Actinomycetota bacterium]